MVCTKCNSTCESCQDFGQVGDDSVCITCAPSTNFKVGSECFDSCPSGYYVNSIGTDIICAMCDFPCYQCDKVSTYCTACIPNTPYVLVGNNCSTTIP